MRFMVIVLFDFDRTDEGGVCGIRKVRHKEILLSHLCLFVLRISNI